MILPLSPWSPGGDPVDLDTQMRFKGTELKAYGNVRLTESLSGPEEVVLSGDCLGPGGVGSEAFSVGGLVPTWGPSNAWAHVYGGRGSVGYAQSRAQSFVPEEDFFPLFLTVRWTKDNTPSEPSTPVVTIRDNLSYFESYAYTANSYPVSSIPVMPTLAQGAVVDDYVPTITFWTAGADHVPLKAGTTYFIHVRTSLTTWNEFTSVDTRIVPDYYSGGSLWTDNYGVWEEEPGFDMEFQLEGVVLL